MACTVLIIADWVIVRSGLETLEREGPDIVCLDIEMPEMDGLEERLLRLLG